MARLIDVDELKSIRRMSDRCEECKQDPRKCADERIYTPMDVCCMLDDATTVHVTPPPRGRWVKITGMMPPECRGHYQCSKCGWYMKGLRNTWTREEEMSYCPNCGAKMDEGEEKWKEQMT